MSFVEVSYLVQMYKQPTHVVIMVENEHTRNKFVEYLSAKFEITFSNGFNKF